jgi:hypothetical protein
MPMEKGGLWISVMVVILVWPNTNITVTHSYQVATNTIAIKWFSGEISPFDQVR